MNLKDKNIVLGVTGSIAAYKACDIASKLVKLEANVHVLMTENAKKFVSPLTFSSLTGNNVHDMWEDHEYKIGHIALAKLADLVLVAPATANIIAKFAYGICDDLLTTTVLATKAPVVIAPAMNTNMLENEITQDNINYLKNKSCYFIESDEGRLACGDVGKGKLANADKIIEFLLEFQQGGRNDAPNLIPPTVGDAPNLIPPCMGATRKSESFFRGGVANENSDNFSSVCSENVTLPNPPLRSREGVTDGCEFQQGGSNDAPNLIPPTVEDAPNLIPPCRGATRKSESFFRGGVASENNDNFSSVCSENVTLPNPPLPIREGVTDGCEFQQGGSNDAPNLIPPCRGATRKSESFFRGGVASENSDYFSTTVGDAQNPFPPTTLGGTKGGEIFVEQKSILLKNTGENSVTLPNPPLRSREGVYREQNYTNREGVTGGDNSDESLLDRYDLLGKEIIISAGSTISPIDPVRYISNHSSGKMGYAIAENALKRGAKVFLVAGNTSIDCSENIHLYRIKTNKEMFETVKKIIDENHIDFYISAAAPCDFRVKEEFNNKIKKKDALSLELVKDIDILKEVSKLPNKPKLIGFAAETTNLTQYANVKLKEKNLSMIVANDVSDGKVFGQDTNKATLIFANGEIFETDRIQKSELAHIILDKIKDL